MQAKQRLSDRLWGESASIKLIIIVSLLLIFGMLGSKTLWTMERRWANIVFNMLTSGDYLHPYLFGKEYYDKPLLSYWLIVPFAKLSGYYNTFILRIPTALSGCVTLWATYRFALFQQDREFALKTTWLLLTSFGFVFWARVAGADMINMMGIMLALLWYANHESQATFANYFVFLFIIVFTCLCKGLVAAVCVGLVVLPDFIAKKGWKRHFNLKLLLALIINLGIYILPFWLSTYFNSVQYKESGLFEVFHENIVRFFAPFDHKGPWYTYFLFLPYYSFPWIIFFIPALVMMPKRWPNLSWGSRWVAWMTLLLFVFFSLSQSRRSYYILPMLPFVALMTADWIQSKKIGQIAAVTVIVMIIVLAGYYWIGIPLHYHGVSHNIGYDPNS